MSLINVLYQKPIHSYSSQYGYVYTADNINNGNYLLAPPYIWVSGEDQTVDQWIIIDLSETRILDQVRLYSAYYDATPEMAVNGFRILLSNTGASSSDFFEVASGSLALPTSDDPPPNYVLNLPLPMPARYVKVIFGNNHGDPNYLLAGELEALSSHVYEGHETITSDAYILRETLNSDAQITKETLNSDAYIVKETLNSDAYIVKPTPTIESDAQIVKEFLEIINSNAYIYVESLTMELISDTQIIKEFLGTIDSDTQIVKEFPETLVSDAQVIKEFLEIINSGTYITKEFLGTITSDAQITKETLNSDAYIIPPIAYITSDAVIISEGLGPILISSTKILQSGSLDQRNMFVIGAGTQFSSSRGIYLSSQIASSSQTVVQDIVISGILDLASAGTPLSYDNYDWAYDWVTREWNGCIVKFEGRQANDTYSLNGESWSQIYNGQVIPRVSVKRYHQWCLHLWASGSRDFELHQFSIKCFVNNNSNAIYSGLIT